ncbi:MAG: cation diffusion facilitator family transporter [Acetivibrionales bacterium]
MERYVLTRRIAVLGIAANIFLLISKLAVGFFTMSQAMIADGFNSAGDVFASFMTYAGNKVASKPEDQTHPYGHGKAEYIFSMIISFSLMIIAYKIFRSSLDSIINKRVFVFSWWLIAIALFTILTKLLLYIYTKSKGNALDSLLLIANSEDHRNDVFVTSSTLLGIILGSWRIYWIDGVVGICISIWIAYTGMRIFRSAYRVLMDTNIDTILKQDITDAVEAVEGVDHIDDITAKPVGVNYIVIVKVSVQGSLTVNESHGIAARIREKIRGFKKVDDVVVHINPV